MRDADYFEKEFLVHEFFFVRLLFFEILSILMYVTSRMQTTEEIFCESDSDANQ